LTVALQSRTVKALDLLFKEYAGPPFSVRLCDGRIWYSSQEAADVCTIICDSPQALRSLLLRPTQLTLGEAFIAKDIDVEGDIFAVFEIARHVFTRPQAKRRRALEIAAAVFSAAVEHLRSGRQHSEERDKSVISHHYDQPVQFYRPWLGSTMVYSCAYFRSPVDDIDTAQQNKLELICRKLRLQPGERILDIGCGWGGLVLHAAANHAANATGITLSQQQASTATARIHEAQLEDLCAIRLLDYRKATEALHAFDKIASIGMFEHVGAKNLSLYFQAAYKLLKPGGLFLNHGIAVAHSKSSHNTAFGGKLVPFLRDRLGISPNLRTSFIDRHVFPDGELVTLSHAVRVAEEAGFEVRDVENLREHYELTLHRWVEALQQNAETLRKIVPEKTYRIWLLYMAGSAEAFRAGSIAVYQILLSRPDDGRGEVPLTREDIYRSWDRQWSLP
jgi:cyclopropane-fatty-acyl-phospholipid synthase